MKRSSADICSCATHFGSPKAKNDSQALYQLLLKTKVYETDGIIGSLEYTLLGETVIAEVSKTKLHVEEGPEGLNIYVPKDSKDQEICYLRLLPTKLFNETMMGEVDRNSTLAFDSRAVSIITAIFASSDEVVNLVLEEAGIIPVPYPDQYEEVLQQPPPDDVWLSPGIDQQHNAESENASVGSGTQAGITTPGTSASPARSTNFSIPATPTHQATYHSSVPSKPIQLFDSPPRTSPEPAFPENARRPFTPGGNQVEYRRLLNNIITAARNKRGAFPSQGAFNLDELLNALPVEATREVDNYDLPFGVRNENQLAHDMKVGAAGELYVCTKTIEFRQSSDMYRHLKFSHASRLLSLDSVAITGRAESASMLLSMRITVTWNRGENRRRRILHTMILKENLHSF